MLSTSRNVDIGERTRNAIARELAHGHPAIGDVAAAIGVGVEWGDGTLTLKNGKTYTFSVEGLTVVDLGVSEISATGEVYDLADVSKFPGTFTAAKAGGALGGGAEWSVLENQNGVIMKVKATQAGVKLSLGAEGLKVSLK